VQIPVEGFDPPSVPFVLELPATETWSSLQWAFLATNSQQLASKQFALLHREKFISDIRAWIIVFTNDVDQAILKFIGSATFQRRTFSCTFAESLLLHPRLSSIPLHLLLLRAKPLVLLNWMAAQKVFDYSSLSPFISVQLMITEFQKRVHEFSTDNRERLYVNRLAAVDVRNGVSQNLRMTLMAQVSSQYNDPGNFRAGGDQPWKAYLDNEKGIDVGGPARELVAECALDLCSPSCGLVVPIPNAWNDIGDMRELVIPYPSAKHTDVVPQYRFAGALIGIAIRSGLVQDFAFPPLVWEYLASKTLTIERVYEIDQNYKMLIQSLLEAISSNISEAEFAARFQLMFVITDLAGEEHPLTQRGKRERVTLANCQNFISLANDFRLSELRSSLEEMRMGLWTNLGFAPIKGLDWRILEFSACGEKDIDLELLKQVTRSYFNPVKVELFWKSVEALTPDERAGLLKFATGRTKLPPKIGHGQVYLRIDDSEMVDVLPGASTYSHELDWPSYTSYTKALHMLRVAISYTGTFENS
jgi:hypothetical protein